MKGRYAETALPQLPFQVGAGSREPLPRLSQTDRRPQNDAGDPARRSTASSWGLELAMTWEEAEALMRGEVPAGVQDACIGLAMDMRGYR